MGNISYPYTVCEFSNPNTKDSLTEQSETPLNIINQFSINQ